MRICVVNNSRLPDRDVLPVIVAINVQLVTFAYYWSTVAQLRLEGSRGRRISMKELRGDALIYLQDEPAKDALGWHDADQYGVPYGVVYTRDPAEPWSVTLSHEVLELLLDPHCNRLAAGPHPDPSEERDVFHWYEACDAVQASTYEIAGVEVSDFVLPGYFTPGEEPGMRLSYLGVPLRSFGVAPGGYVGFYDPQHGEHRTWFADLEAREAFESRGGHGRSGRYQTLLN